MDNPNYYAILTADVRYDENLKPNEKLLYAEITALSQKNGYCYASNGYFADLYKVEKMTVSRWIRNLEKHGYIQTIVERDSNKRVIKRAINLIKKADYPLDKKIYPLDFKVDTLYTKKSIPSRQKSLYPLDKKVKGNNTSINTTSKNNTSNNNKTPISPFANIENEKLKQVLLDFKDMRKLMKKPMTEKAEQLLLNKLNNLSADTEQQIKIVEQSIERNWLSVFPLKENTIEKKKIPTDEEYSAGLIEGVDYLSG